MKVEINNAILKKNKLKFGEIFLFREMTKSLNKYVPAVFVQETHGRRGWVRFQSQITQDIRQKEISDLLIICYNKPTNEIKVSFLQAKYHRTKTVPFLKFHGDYLQLELLKDRPDIDPNNIYRFPQNVLNFSCYRSLTNYGVFFHDNNGEIDMLYSVADFLNQTNTTGLIGSIQFPGNSNCPRANCFTSNASEMVSTCNIDLFEKGLINFQIGAPISRNPMISRYFKGLLRQIQKSGNLDADQSIFNFILGDIINDDDIIKDSDFEGNPSILILQTNVERIENE
jgi:hypothetical protein